MVKAEELIVVLFGAAFVATIFVQYRSLKLPELRLFLAGSALLLSAVIFALLEGWLGQETFGLIERLLYALAGICFATGSILLGVKLNEGRGEHS